MPLPGIENNIVKDYETTKFMPHKIDYSLRLKSSFYNKGANINATIEDENFKSMIQNGVTLSSSSLIPVKLRIEYKVDEYGTPIKNTTEYSIEEVIHDYFRK